MKVLFVQPYNMLESVAGDDTSMFEPLALEYLSANIQDICQTYLIDMRLDKNIEKVIKEYKPDIIGITGYTVHVNSVKEIVRRIHAADDRIKVVIGGHHASVAYKDYFEISPDCIITGEGIYVFRELV
jgi:radical SAM superfamily enzyme YgiQ (UPF0313 family)